MTKKYKFHKYSPEHSPTEKHKTMSFLVYNKTLANEVTTFINSSEPSGHLTRSFGRENHCEIAASPKILILSLPLTIVTPISAASTSFRHSLVHGFMNSLTEFTNVIKMKLFDL